MSITRVVPELLPLPDVPPVLYSGCVAWHSARHDKPTSTTPGDHHELIQVESHSDSLAQVDHDPALLDTTRQRLRDDVLAALPRRFSDCAGY